MGLAFLVPLLAFPATLALDQMQAEAKHPVWVFTEIPWLAMFGHIALATLLGFLAGVALGLVSFWTMKKLKWFHFPPVTKTWVLVVFALWLVGCISLAGTVWGFFEGASSRRANGPEGIARGKTVAAQGGRIRW